MKTNAPLLNFHRRSLARWTGLAALAALALAACSSHAADSNPPQRMTYQGFLVDANGAVLAPTTPINYPMVFRIYSASTGGTAALWAEQQVVTVDKGNFNVLLGDGSNVGSEPRPDLATLFGGTTASDRFVGVTVTINNTALVIAPRLRLLPSPYAFLATSAAQLVQPSGAPVLAYNSGNNRVEITGNVSATGFVGSGASLTGFTAGQIPNLDASKITSGTLSADRMPGSFASGNFTGSVGIGSTSPQAKLEIQSGAGSDGSSDQKAIALAWSAGGYRHWIRTRHNASIGSGNAIEFFVNNSANSAGSSAPGTGSLLNMTLDSGRVGIGTASPQRLLHLSGTDNVQARIDSSNTAGTWLALGNSSASGRYWQFISTGSGNGGGAGNLLFTTGTSDGFTTATPLTLQPDGDVGIGTLTPSARLHVTGGGIKLESDNTIELGAGVSGKQSDAGKIGYGTYTTDTLDIVGAGTTVASRKIKLWAEGGLTIGGSVGIGTSTPTAPLEVSGSATLNKSYGWLNPAGNTGTSSGSNPYSIVASHRIAATEFNAVSDARIKEVVGLSDNQQDLASIRNLRVTDYRLVDKVTEGNDLKKGFIAQEVKAIIPEAVTSSRRFVPDIYALPSAFAHHAESRTLAVTMAKAHGLKEGDRVQLFADESRLELVVAAVSSPERFVVGKCEKGPKQVFIYGKEVPDFLTLNYDRIFTTGISAMQELARQVDSLKAREARLTELEKKASKVDVLERELAELRKLVAQLAAAPRNGANPAASFAEAPGPALSPAAAAQ